MIQRRFGAILLALSLAFPFILGGFVLQARAHPLSSQRSLIRVSNSLYTHAQGRESYTTEIALTVPSGQIGMTLYPILNASGEGIEHVVQPSTAQNSIWALVAPSSFLLSDGEQQQLGIICDASKLAPGVYWSDFAVSWRLLHTTEPMILIAGYN